MERIDRAEIFEIGAMILVIGLAIVAGVLMWPLNHIAASIALGGTILAIILGVALPARNPRIPLARAGEEGAHYLTELPDALAGEHGDDESS